MNWFLVDNLIYDKKISNEGIFSHSICINLNTKYKFKIQIQVHLSLNVMGCITLIYLR